jgi:Domain of unknown function (DUF5655)/Domain of unknown function (DUF4287)
MPAKSAKSPYDVHPSVKMVQDWIAALKSKTGRSLEEWLELVEKCGPPTNKERREWLKAEYKLGTNSAWWIADRAQGMGLEDGDPEGYLRAAVGYVDAMYAGAKAGLRPLHDQILKVGRKLGKDVKVCPCQTMVPLYRNHVFAQIKPTTRTRIDLGFALGDFPATGRLIDTGGFAKKDRITHRIPIAELNDIDDEVTRYLKMAYERDV